MAEPEPVVQEDKGAGEDKERVGELDDGETPEVAGVDEMGEDPEEREAKGELVDGEEEDLDSNYGVDETAKEAAG